MQSVENYALEPSATPIILPKNSGIPTSYTIRNKQTGEEKIVLPEELSELTQQQIDQFRKRASAAGHSEQEINAEISRKSQEVQASYDIPGKQNNNLYAPNKVEAPDTIGGYTKSRPSTNPSLKYNSFEGRWQYANENDELKYNPFESTWEYAPKDATTQYNTFEDKWQYAKDDETLQYNTFEDKWDYGSKDSKLEYNAFENNWEQTEPGEKLQYNDFENKWSYE